MRTNLFVLSALAALLVIGSGAAAASESTDGAIAGVTASFIAPGTIDAFASVFAPTDCSARVTVLDREVLIDLFSALKHQSMPALQLTSIAAQAKTLGGVVANVCGSDQSLCSCGTCMEINGNAACSAAFACCPRGYDCDANCKSDLANLTQTSQGSCKVHGNHSAAMTVPDVPSPDMPAQPAGSSPVPAMTDAPGAAKP